MERECFYFDFKWKIVQQESLLKEKFRSKKSKGRMNGNDHNNKRFNLNKGTNRFKIKKSPNLLSQKYSIHSKYWIFKIGLLRNTIFDTPKHLKTTRKPPKHPKHPNAPKTPHNNLNRLKALDKSELKVLNPL